MKHLVYWVYWPKISDNTDFAEITGEKYSNEEKAFTDFLHCNEC